MWAASIRHGSLISSLSSSPPARPPSCLPEAGLRHIELSNLCFVWYTICHHGAPNSLRVPQLALFLLIWVSALFISKLGPSHPKLDTSYPISVTITDLSQRVLLSGLCTNIGLKLRNPTRNPARYIRPDLRPNAITFLVLLLSGDVELNPGPRQSDIFPCGYGQKPVTWSTPGICCGNCDIWFHCSCVDIGSLEYSRLGHESQSWDCYRCGSRNESLIYHAYNVDVRNSFEALSSINDDSVFLPTSPNFGLPKVRHSSMKSHIAPMAMQVLLTRQHLHCHPVYPRCQLSLLFHRRDH